MQQVTRQQEEDFMSRTATWCTHPRSFIYRDPQGREHCLLCYSIATDVALIELTRATRDLVNAVNNFAGDYYIFKSRITPL